MVGQTDECIQYVLAPVQLRSATDLSALHDDDDRNILLRDLRHPSPSLAPPSHLDPAPVLDDDDGEPNSVQDLA